MVTPQVLDTIPVADSLPTTADTTLTARNKKLPISKDALPITVLYGARDTQWYEHKLKQMHLYGEAYVEYGAMKLTAGYIVFNLETNEAKAYAIEDSLGQQIQKPKFKDGDQEFNYEELTYNFETNKGLVRQAVTTFTDLYVLGAKTKFVGKNEEHGHEDDVIYNQNALITTCNHEHPHYGIRTTKLKVIPNKIGVTGPAQLELGGVPMPLWLPFGFFPLSDGSSSGLLFPSNFPYQRDLGFGIERFGWYFDINDYMDLTLTADYFTRGTWGLQSYYRYKKRYKYNGDVGISFRDTKIESDEDASISSRKSFSVNITHRQDPKAHPFSSFGGNIQFSTMNHIQTTRIDPYARLNNTYRSNFYYKHSMPNLPFSFNLGLNHNQNTQTNIVNITLPDIQLNMQTIYPFKRKKQVGEERWYEKINVSGSSTAKNQITATDSTLFTRQTWDNMRSGVRHSYSANVSLKLLKYFSLNPRASYQEDWVFNTINKQYDSGQDTLYNNKINGFDAYRSWNVGANINTTLFGSILSEKGWFRGIRHTMKPSVGYQLSPNLRDKYVEDIYYNDELITSYNRFENGAYGSPSFSKASQKITFGITNVVEMKYFSKKHEEERKYKILQNLNVSGSYDLEADSLNWSPISVSGNTTLLKNLTNLRFNFTLDPYLQSGTKTINKLVSTEQKIPVRLSRGSITLNSGITLKKLLSIGQAEKQESNNDKTSKENKPRFDGDKGPVNSEYDFPSLEDIIGNFRLDHNVVYSITSENNQDSIFLRTHTIGVRGNLPITENWTINVGNIGYDFTTNKITYPYLGFTRKLHCWYMTFNWAPNANAFGFFIGVNPGTLDFLKYNYGQGTAGRNVFR